MNNSRRQNLRRGARAIAAAALLLPLTSCIAAVAAGVGVAGYVQYDRNEASAEYEADFETTWEATLAALDELGYTEREVQWINDTTAEVEGLAKKDEHEKNDLKVRIERHPGVTRVLIRIGTFYTSDHLRKATLIFEEIERRLEPAQAKSK